MRRRAHAKEVAHDCHARVHTEGDRALPSARVRRRLQQPLPRAPQLAAAAMAEASCCSYDDVAREASAATEEFEACLDAIMELEQARARCRAAAAAPHSALRQVGFKQTESRDTFAQRLLAFRDGVIVEPQVRRKIEKWRALPSTCVAGGLHHLGNLAGRRDMFFLGSWCGRYA